MKTETLNASLRATWASGRRISLAMALLSVGGSLPARAEQPVYIYSYFKGNGESGVYLSHSTDGLKFTPLNNEQPVFRPPNWPGENLTRDPSIVFGPDGLYHMVWTTNWWVKSIGHATSPDLVNWSEPQRIQVWPDGSEYENSWAPEIFYDDSESKFLVVWASSTDRSNHRLFSFTTSDFQSISTTAPFYDPGYAVIDGAIAHDAAHDDYVMVFKDERDPDGANPGGKAVYITRRDSLLSGTWDTRHGPIVGPTSGLRNEWAEGPSLVKVGDTWQIHYDSYTEGHLSVVTSTDLVNWTDQTAAAVLPSGHHGTVFAVSPTRIGWPINSLPGDLDGNSQIDVQDWITFLAYHRSDFNGLTLAERRARGDMDLDGDNDRHDFQLFQTAYHLARGTGSVEGEDMVAAPEPSSFGLAAGCAALAIVAPKLDRGLRIRKDIRLYRNGKLSDRP